MKHIQLYEAFNAKPHIVVVYEDYYDWMEFMKSRLSGDYFRMLNHTDYERMWRDRTAYQSPSYVVDNKWIFWLDPPKYKVVNPREIAVVAINTNGSTQDYSQKDLESATGSSYKDLIAQAKTPEEGMLDEIERDPLLAGIYQDERPEVFKKMMDLPDVSSEIKDLIKSSLKWKSIKNYI